MYKIYKNKNKTNTNKANFNIEKVKQEDIIGNTKTISMSFVIIHDDVRLENTRDLIGLN